MNMQVWLDEMLKAPRKKAMPVLSFPSVQLMGITVSELINSSDKLAEGMKRVADRVDAAASLGMMDLSVEAECFGSQIRFSDHEVPTVIGAIVSSMKDAENLQIPELGAARSGIYLESIEKAVRLIQDRPVFAGAIGPFSLAGRLLEVNKAMLYCYDEPEMVQLVLEKVTAFQIEYIKAYKQTGANGVFIAEPLAGILSPKLAAKFSAPYVKQMIDAVQDENFICIYHNCGGTTIKTIDSILSNGASIYHFGNAIQMKDMLPKIPADKIVMGNIDPAGEFCNGTPASIREATLALLKECSSYPNFVISSGCDIPPMSKWENIDAFFAAVQEFYDQNQ